jgi:biotin-(acetyl-CoA carboxylase) ligase
VAHRGLGLVHGRLTAHDALDGRAVESEDASLSGVACGIDPEGRLMVRRSDGVVTKVASGEIRLRIG